MGGYPFAVALMAVVCVSPYVVFKKKARLQAVRRRHRSARFPGRKPSRAPRLRPEARDTLAYGVGGTG